MTAGAPTLGGIRRLRNVTMQNLTVTGTLTTTGSITDNSDLILANGKAIKTGTTAADTALLQAYDVDGTAYKTFLTLTAGNTPSLAIAAPSGGTVAIDGATIGGTTAAAGTFTTATAASAAITNTTNQIVLGTTNTVTISSTAPSSSRTITLADPGANANLITSVGIGSTQTTRVTAQVDKTDQTLVNVTGLSQTVQVGTYTFDIFLPTTCGGTGGVKLAFNYTTAVVSVINAQGYGFTASAIATAGTTTTTTQTTIIGSNTAFTTVHIKGSMVVTTGGTVDLQFAENSTNSTSSVLVGGWMKFTRIA